MDLLAVQGTLKSLLQHHTSKASLLRCSAFFMVPLSHPYMTIGNTIALTVQTFPRWLIHMTGKSMVSVCRRPQLLPIVGFSLGLHREAGFLQSKLIQRRRRKLLYPSWLKTHKANSIRFSVFCWLPWLATIQCERVLHKGMDARRQGSLELSSRLVTATVYPHCSYQKPESHGWVFFVWFCFNLGCAWSS